MHKLLEFVCDELKDLESKTDKGKLTMQDIQYADTLAHLKKNLLTADAMEESGYSNDYRGSYRRGRDSMGRYVSRDEGSYDRDYSRDTDEMKYHLEDMKRNAKDDKTRHMIDEWMRQLK